MESGWEWRFGLIRAAVLEINHALPTPRSNSVFQGGFYSSGQWCRGYAAGSAFTFHPESMEHRVGHDSPGHRRCVLFVSVKGGY